MNLNFTLFAQAAEFLLFIWFTARFIWPILSSTSGEVRSTPSRRG